MKQKSKKLHFFQWRLNRDDQTKSVECGTSWGKFPHMRAKIPHFVPVASNCKICNLTGFSRCSSVFILHVKCVKWI